MMDNAKKRRLAEKGWKVGNVEDFLQLSADEAADVEQRLKAQNNTNLYLVGRVSEA
jgi:hypothetical protein